LKLKKRKEGEETGGCKQKIEEVVAKRRIQVLTEEGGGSIGVIKSESVTRKGRGKGGPGQGNLAERQEKREKNQWKKSGRKCQRKGRQPNIIVQGKRKTAKR